MSCLEMTVGSERERERVSKREQGKERGKDREVRKFGRERDGHKYCTQTAFKNIYFILNIHEVHRRTNQTAMVGVAMWRLSVPERDLCQAVSFSTLLEGIAYKLFSM